MIYKSCVKKEIKMTVIEILKILSDNNRLRILNLLYVQELCVCELEYLLGISQSNLSKHLRLMSDAGFLENRRENKFASVSYTHLTLPTKRIV